MAYEKLNLKNGVVLDETHLKHIENGIVANEAAIFRLENANLPEGVQQYPVTGWGTLETVQGYINNNGTVIEHTSYVSSDFIPAIVGTEITYRVGASSGICCYLALYDVNKTFLADVSLFAKVDGASNGVGADFEGSIIVPVGAAYFRIMDRTNKSGTFSYYQRFTEEDEGKTKWMGKQWFAFGTSITDTSYTNAETGTPTGKYVPYLVEKSGLIVHNKGIAGGTIGKGGIHGGSASILNKILSTDVSEADLITIEGFVNDFACAVDLGELGDTGGTDAIENTEKISICGALYRAIKHCLETAPKATIILLTESTGKEYTLTGSTSPVSYCFARLNSIGKLQKDYNDAIIEMGKFMGVRVIDAGSKSQINCFNPEYIVDQIHHTELGGEQYATVIWDELKNISPKVVESGDTE